MALISPLKLFGRRSISYHHQYSLNHGFVTLQCIKFNKVQKVVKNNRHSLQNTRSFAALSQPQYSSSNDFFEFENFNDFQQFPSFQMDSTDFLIGTTGIIIMGTVGLYYYNEKVLSNLVKYSCPYYIRQCLKIFYLTLY